jgi:hypothetical protein
MPELQSAGNTKLREHLKAFFYLSRDIHEHDYDLRRRVAFFHPDFLDVFANFNRHLRRKNEKMLEAKKSRSHRYFL